MPIVCSFNNLFALESAAVTARSIPLVRMPKYNLPDELKEAYRHYIIDNNTKVMWDEFIKCLNNDNVNQAVKKCLIYYASVEITLNHYKLRRKH